MTNTQQNTYKLTLKELSDFSRQLGAMIGSGVSLIRAMSILVQRESKPKIKSIYTDMYRKLQQGQTLSMAMESEGKAFPELMINMYRTGESSGQMEKVAMTMALQYEKDDHIKRKIRNAMIYPIILLCVTVFVIIVVFTWIIPSFSSVFEGMELPLITKNCKWSFADYDTLLVLASDWHLMYICVHHNAASHREGSVSV